MAKQKTASKPAEQAKSAKVSPISGVAPPVEHQFKPGQSGNPAGRAKSVGSSVKEWWNAMAEWPREKLKEVIDDPASPAGKVAAARIFLYATSDERNNSGVPFAGNELDRILDRTDGKPTSSVDVTTGGQPIYKALAGVSKDEL